MYITRKDVEKILAVMTEFDDAQSYCLEADNSSGIGSVLTLTMKMELHNRSAEVRVEITGVENW